VLPRLSVLLLSFLLLAAPATAAPHGGAEYQQTTPGDTAVAAAESAVGTPYASGGTTTDGFDCSGLTRWAYKKAGIRLPHSSYDQFELGDAVAKADLVAGDLVFFDTAGDGASHVGIATDAKHAISATSHGVMEHTLRGGYWGSHYVGARRVA
jgi:cell wall-associated NlpC family hydrolase